MVRPVRGLGDTEGWRHEAAMVGLHSEGCRSICDTGNMQDLPYPLRLSSCPHPVAVSLVDLGQE